MLSIEPGVGAEVGAEGTVEGVGGSGRCGRSRASSWASILRDDAPAPSLSAPLVHFFVRFLSLALASAPPSSARPWLTCVCFLVPLVDGERSI